MSKREELHLIQAMTIAMTGRQGAGVAEVKAVQALWEMAVPEVVEENECRSTSSAGIVSLFFVEAPVDSSHLRLVLSYALCLSSLPSISRVAVVGSSEVSNHIYESNLQSLLYKQYQIQLALLADLAPESQIEKIRLMKLMPGTIPKPLLQGPVIRFQGSAPWNCAHRYLRFISSQVPVYSANFEKGVKKHPLDKLALVRVPAEIAVGHVYYQPPLILRPPVCSILQRDSAQCVTALVGPRIHRAISNLSIEIWDKIGNGFSSIPSLTWRLVGSQQISRVEELIPNALRSQITVEGVVTHQQLCKILSESKLLVYPGGVGGGGGVAMTALASGVVITGVSDGNEVSAMFEEVNFVDSQIDLWRIIPEILTSTRRLTETWIQQFEKISPRLDLKSKAIELLRNVTAQSLE